MFTVESKRRGGLPVAATKADRWKGTNKVAVTVYISVILSSFTLKGCMLKLNKLHHRELSKKKPPKIKCLILEKNTLLI